MAWNRHGLLRFDGVLLERYKGWERGYFASLSMRSLLATPDGGLWVGYTNGGASFLNRGQVYNYGEDDGLPNGGVGDFAEDAEGRFTIFTKADLAVFVGRDYAGIDHRRRNSCARLESGSISGVQPTPR